MGRMPAELDPPKRDVDPEKKPVFVSYYTARSGYKAFADDLEKTMKKVGVEFTIQSIRSRGDWGKNCRIKPEFLKKMRKRFPGRPLVWVDSDAIFNNYPGYFDTVDCDVAAYHREGEGFIASLVYVADTPEANKFLDRWERLCNDPDAKDGGLGDQRLLQQVLAKSKKLKIGKLPHDYCFIVGLRNVEEENPINEQRQASRKLKK